MRSISYFSFGVVYLIAIYFGQSIAWPEMLLWPYLTANGFEFYIDIIAIYPPLFLKTLELIASFFWNPKVLYGLSLTMMLVNLGFSYFLLKTFIKNFWIIFLSLGFYAFWQIRFEGVGIWFDHVLVPFFILSYLSFIKKQSYTLGLWIGLGLLIKQTTVYLLPLSFLGTKPKNWPKIFVSLVLTLMLGVIFLVPASLWDDLFHKTITMGLLTLPHHPEQQKLPTLSQLILSLIPFLMVISLSIFSWKKAKLKLEHIFADPLTWAVLSSLGTYPRFELFHFQPALPFLALGFGLALVKLTAKKMTFNLKIILVSIGVVHLAIIGNYYYEYGNRPTRFLEPKVVEAVLEVETMVKDESIYIYNTQDQLYVLLNKIPINQPIYPSTSLYYDYPGIQDQTLESFQTNPPKFILRGEAGQPKLIEEYVWENYKPVWRHNELKWKLYKRNLDPSTQMSN